MHRHRRHGGRDAAGALCNGGAFHGGSPEGESGSGDLRRWRNAALILGCSAGSVQEEELGQRDESFQIVRLEIDDRDSQPGLGLSLRRAGHLFDLAGP